jgi:hypothetical protein
MEGDGPTYAAQHLCCTRAGPVHLSAEIFVNRVKKIAPNLGCPRNKQK